MKGFRETLSALGDFWLQENPSVRWPGTVTFERFPDVKVTTNGRAAVPHFRDKVLHGETIDSSFVSIFNASGVPSGFRRETTKPNSVSRSTNAHLTGNYMLIGDTLHDSRDSVKRVSFSSTVAERIFPHYADPLFADLNLTRRQKSFLRQSTFFKKVSSVVCHDHSVRFRILRSLLPNAIDGQRLLFTINFLKLVSPEKAMVTVIHFEELLSLICGHPLDIFNVRLLHLTGTQHTRTDLYFSNFVGRQCKIQQNPLPLIDFTGDGTLFRLILKKWVLEEQSVRSRRRLYVSTFEYEGPSFSQFRDIFIAVEMLTDQTNQRPISISDFNELRRKIGETIKTFFESKNIRNDQALDHFERHFSFANSYIARRKIEIAMETIPSQLRDRIFSDRNNFIEAVLRIRNKAVHDLGELKQEDYVDVSYRGLSDCLGSSMPLAI